MATAVLDIPGSRTIEALTEYASSAGIALRIDRDKAVISGVKILGLESSNGRVYSDLALEQARQLYEGAKVNVNHPAGAPASPRDYRDRFGTLAAIEHRRGAGLYGNLHFNPKHAVAEQFLWDAEHNPANVGLSHNVEARTVKRDGKTVVESISRVRSVDLVADPATTNSLYESQQTETHEMSLESITLEQLTASRPDLAKAILEQHANGEAAKAAAAETKALQEQLDGYKAREALAAKRTKIDAAIAEAKLPKELVTDVFVESCLAATDGAKLKAVIEDRAAMAKITLTDRGRPKSKEQNLAEQSGKDSGRTFLQELNAA